MKATLVTSQPFLKDAIFSNNSRDNLSRRFIILRKLLASEGIAVATYDINPIESSKVSIHFDIHLDCRLSKLSQRGHNAILVVSESPIINKINNDQKLRSHFKKILTWETEKVNNIDTYWIGCGSGIYETEFDIEKIQIQKQFLSCMIYSNKSSDEPNELYSARREVIAWYENNAPDSMNLYGMGWGKRTFKGLIRPLNRIEFFKQYKYRPPLMYKGQVKSKASTLKIHKFSFCYENVSGHAGYITEKIFDSMMVGCVPVYLGAPNVGNFIPRDCFIDRTDFKDYEDLHRYLIGISSSEYENYLRAIENYRPQYLQSSFCDQKWAEVIVKHTLDLI